MHRTIHTLSALFILAHLGACASTETRPSAAGTSLASERPVAILNGYGIERSSIEAQLGELGGDEVLSELVLDRALEQQCRDAGIVITTEHIARERALLGETLGFESGSGLTTETLDRLRAARGLGPVRFEQLLRRTAMLRTLTDGAEPSADQIERTLDASFGTRYRVRLFVSAESAPALNARSLTSQSPPEARAWVFAEQSARSSIHPSAPRGGLIEELSPRALGYPSAVLSVLGATPAGGCSAVLSTEAGFVVVYVEAQIPAREPSDSERDRVIERLREDTQRGAMQRLAAEILDQQEMVVMNRSLHWAWTQRR